MFEFFWGKKSVFSNWYQVDFKIDGITYNCSEQWYMYRKARYFGDVKLAERILCSHDPREMKRLGRRVRNFCELKWRSISRRIKPSFHQGNATQRNATMRIATLCIYNVCFDSGNATQHVASCCVALLRIASGAKIFSVACCCSRVHVVVHDIFRAHWHTLCIRFKMVHFTTEKIEELIELIKDRSYLYDTSQHDYRDAIKVNNTWESIANALDVEEITGM